MALDVDPRLENGLVGSGHRPARRFRKEIDGFQTRLVRHVHVQLLDVGLVVAIGRRFILSLSLPSDYHNTIDVVFMTQIDHPDGVLDEVVVDDGAAVQGRLGAAVDGQIGPAVLPVFPQVPLIIQPRITMERQILNASGDGVDVEESWSAVALMGTSE